MFRLSLLFLLLPITFWSQTTITGVVKNRNKPVELANIYIEKTLEGTSSDKDGKFSFSTELKGNTTLVISSLGFETLEKNVEIGSEELYLEIFLKEEDNKLDEVVIYAGTFEASEKKATTILRPLDIVRNPAASADVFSALQTLPGVSAVGDQTGVFVRGGEATETKTFIDGALVTNPFFSSVSEIPARGRFNPFLFQGTIFNTGGYSAEYGQALSSVILLNTKDLPSNDILTFDLNIASLGGSITRKLSERTSFSANLSYTNLSPLFEIVPQNREWLTAPTNIEGILFLKHKNKNEGIFKNYLQYQNGRIGLDLQSPSNTADNQEIQNRNQNFFFNNSFEGYIGSNWKTLVVTAFSYDEDKTGLGNDNVASEEFLAQSRLTVKKNISSGFTLKTGGEIIVSDGTYSFNELSANIRNALSALYLESDLRLSKTISGRIGIRGEYSSLLDSWNLVPRISLSKKIGKSSSLSLAYGNFRQVPEPEILREQTKNIDFEGSQHIILNYQLKNEGHTFRIEGYFKDYSSLVRELPENIYENSGSGFARGIDIFWKDEKTIPNLSYWISYSFLDSQRLYRDFPIEATPTFVAKHNANFISNYKIGKKTTLGASYTYSSGRPFINPNNPSFLSDRTPDFHNINFNGSLLSNIFGDLTVFYASLRNPFNFRQVFNYRYSDNGTSRVAVNPASDWSFFVGMVININ
ncbi:TonB-dependent receptor [Maribacter sp. IgM3_T14_3]|uniref:TonB-dependent receptor n=1 Tax=Maribacter sp. IgM3_T14_3 TaxID=3415140 RepID=UPI003C6ED1A1